MKKALLNLFFVFCVLASSAQENNFYISKTYFEDQKVIFFSENRGGALVVLSDYSIYKMNRHLEFSDVTSLFSEEIRKDITCVQSVNEKVFLIGTSNHSLIKFDDGVVSNLADFNENFPVQINSIDFNGNADNSQLLIATNSGIWGSDNLKNFENRNVSYTTNSKLFGGRESILLTEYPFCTQVPGQYGIEYSFPGNGVALFRIFENEGFEIEHLNDVTYAKLGFGSGTFNNYAYFATDNGLYAQHINSCSLDTSNLINNSKVYDLEIISSELSKYAMMIASDKGLLFAESTFLNYFDVYNPQYFIIQGIDTANYVRYSVYHNFIWVGTNKGLVVVKEDNLVQKSLAPGVVNFDTLDYCQEYGVFPYVHFNNQLDLQWYLNGNKVEGAIGGVCHMYEEGLYSVKYTYENQEYDVNVAYARLFSTFTERIHQDNYLICPTDHSVFITIDSMDYSTRTFDFYSLERGHEGSVTDTNPYLVVTEGGHYYFISTNCNGFTYTSDTVEVNKSILDLPVFDLENLKGLHCEGDTIFVSGATSAVNYLWKVSGDIVKNDIQPYIRLDHNYSTDNLLVTTTDVYGCQLSAVASLGEIYEAPVISEDQLNKYICEPEAIVSFQVPYGSTVNWEGYNNDTYHPVKEGSYDVNVSNGVCEDFNAVVNLEYFDPLPQIVVDTFIVAVNDTLKFRVDPFASIDNYGKVHRSGDKNFLYVTSSSVDIIPGYIVFPTKDCFKTYSFVVQFVEPWVLSSASLKSGFSIYPNPTTDGVKIEIENACIQGIQLLDVNGRMIFSQKVDNVQNYYFVFPSFLKSGVYFLKINTGSGDQIHKRILIKD